MSETKELNTNSEELKNEPITSNTTTTTTATTTTELKEEVNKEKKKKTGRLNESADIQLSKLLSYILRHGATKEKLHIRSDGFINLNELLKRPKLKSWNSDDVRRVVLENEKKRFAIVDEVQPDGSITAFIRANQGHSLIVRELELTPVKDPADLSIVVHGTYEKNWENIAREGLRPMSRTHIHFAKGLIGEDGVLSGMRRSCELYIYLDVEKCFKDQIEFYISENGVILSEGLPETKSIPIDYFKSVVQKEDRLPYPKFIPK